MYLNNKGNARILTLVFTLIGMASWYFSQDGKIEGVKKEFDKTILSMESGYNQVKVDYLDGPVQVVENIKDEVSSNSELFDKENKSILGDSTEKTIIPQPSQTPINTNPTKKDEKLNELTSQMVENCKILTEEYNKLSAKNIVK